MATCPTLTYAVTPEKWQTIKAVVEAEMPSLAPMADTGSGVHDGCTIQWTYGHGTTLIVTVTNKPFFVSCDVINHQIDDMIRTLV